MKIYFAGSIRGGREDAAIYAQIIENLREYGEVLTEHVGDINLTAMGDDGHTDKFIHDRDLDWLFSSDLLVAEVSTASLGVGYEIGRAVDADIPVLCLNRQQPGKKLSAMISGSKQIWVENYSAVEEVAQILEKYFKMF